MKKILVVDDLYVIRRLFLRYLEKEGCRVEMAENAESALAAFKKGQFDMAFIDVDLKGGTNGFELARNLRILSPEFRIVIMSARRVNKSGAVSEFDGFLAKPFTLEEIGSFVFGNPA